MTTFSPKAVGSVETRSSTSRPSRSVLMRPSCGLRFSEMSMRESIFTRETMGGVHPRRQRVDGVQHAVDAQAHERLVSRLGSMWMSDGAVVEGVAQQVVHRLHDRLVATRPAPACR